MSTSAAPRIIEFKFVGDPSDLQGALRQVAGESKRTKDKVEANAKDMGKALSGGFAKALLSVEMLKAAARVAAQAIGAVVERAAELDGKAKGAVEDLHTSIQSLTDSIALGFAPQIASVVGWLADLSGGAALATKALFGLDEAQRSGLAAQEQARDAINKQAEAVSALRAELERSQGLDLLTSLSGEAGAATKQLTADLERELGVLRKLKGELGGTAGLGAKGPAAATAKAKGSGGGTHAASASAAAVPTAEVLSDPTFNAGALEKEIASVTASYLTGIDAILASAEEKKRGIQEALDEVVSAGTDNVQIQLDAVRSAREAEVLIEEEAAAQIAEIRDAEQDAALASIEEEHQARVAAAQEAVGISLSMASSISGLVGSIADAVEDGASREGQTRKEAALKAFRIQKALAIVMASINTAGAIVNALATAPNIIAGIVLAALAGVTGAVQIGIIAAKQPPSFHAGGMVGGRSGGAADEVNAVLLEREGVLNRGGVRAAGGERGVRELNRGQGGAQRPVAVGVRVNHRLLDVWLSSDLRRGTGTLTDELRAARPTVGDWHAFR